MLAILSEAEFLSLKTGNNNALQNVVRNQQSQACVQPGLEQRLCLWRLLSTLTLMAVVKEKLVMGVSLTTPFLQIVA